MLPGYTSIQIQSKLRLGKSDFGINSVRVERMYFCIHQTMEKNDMLNSISNAFDGICHFGDD